MNDDNYISNISENEDELDMGLIEKLNQLELEHEQYKEEAKILKNENIQLKQQIEELKLECKHYKKTIKNQTNLINFYKENRAELGNNNDKKKLEKYEERINELEEKIENLSLELKETSAFNEKLVDEIANKKKLEKNQNTEENDLNMKKLEEEIDNTIINNYKSKLDKKNNEIDKLIAKCKEYKENLEQSKKDKESKLKELQKEKEVLEYEIKDKSKKLETALRELNELRSKEGEGEANKEISSEDPKQKLYNEIKEYKKEIEMKNNENNDLKNKLDKCEINCRNEIKAQTEYLNNMIEDYKKNIDNIKEQKIKAIKDYKEQIEKYEVELGKYKCQLANVHFELEKKLILYKNYIRKLQLKLEGLGFKFKDSNHHDNNKVTLNKANTIV